MMKKRAYHEERLQELSVLGKLFFTHPIYKFLALAIIYIVLVNIQNYFSNNLPRIIINIIGVLISIYFVIVIIYFVKRWFNRFINPENLFVLLVTYTLFIIGILLILSTLFNLTEITGLGYLKYGICQDKFDSSMIHSDPNISKQFFYFTSSTFFLIGYGDICPMGLAKYLAILTGFIGHLISVIVVALVINNYLRKKS